MFAKFTPEQAMKTQRGRSCTLSVTSAVDGGEWLTPRPGRLTPTKDPVPIVWQTWWVLGLVLTAADNLILHRDSIPGPSIP